MLSIDFFSHPQPKALYPLTVLQKAVDLTWGDMTLGEFWQYKVQTKVHQLPTKGHEIKVLPTLLPTDDVIRDLVEAGPGNEWRDGDRVWVRWRGDGTDVVTREIPPTWRMLHSAQDWFATADLAVEAAIERARSLQRLQPADLPLPDHVTLIGPRENLHLAEGAKLSGCTLNCTSGPIFIGPKAEVQEGALIRGPFLLAEASVVKMGAKIYGPTVIGAHCKIGGEVSNSVFLGFSNKGHDGFVGNSVIGNWCNLGADTNTSNLKNTYGEVSVFDAVSGEMRPSGRQFVGLTMGDHSKCGINTMFNTGTVVGVGCSIFGGGFSPKHVPSFSWGGPDSQWTFYNLEKMIETAHNVMGRRGVALSETAEAALRNAHAEVTASGEA